MATNIYACQTGKKRTFSPLARLQETATYHCKDRKTQVYSPRWWAFINRLPPDSNWKRAGLQYAKRFLFFFFYEMKATRRKCLCTNLAWSQQVGTIFPHGHTHFNSLHLWWSLVNVTGRTRGRAFSGGTQWGALFTIMFTEVQGKAHPVLPHSLTVFTQT